MEMLLIFYDYFITYLINVLNLNSHVFPISSANSLRKNNFWSVPISK